MYNELLKMVDSSDPRGLGSIEDKSFRQIIKCWQLKIYKAHE